MNDDLRLLYGWVKGSREQVFAWTDTLPPDIYTVERPEFAFGSLRNVHAHIANCYRVWIGRRGLGMDQYAEKLDPTTLTDVPGMRAAFRQVDEMMEIAFERFTHLDAPLDVSMGEHGTLKVSQRWLVMHPLTHEFHHKGQMLTMGRILGHPYAFDLDTDLPEPF